ncbi:MULTISPECIES: ABC transporter permease [unclassified Fusibacter]|uniref:ABC transporter permease subunit n=1 Tax=unclassified Fusibacter TaxID=2624464 RepID=UPI0010123EED|nr:MULTISPECIES: ABC transporter permease [unclassified Fusibacter]MCK8058702.1 ABC transporter permease [Fusibacter sp. A2]NPE21776.1 ABC transporter permease [Fusibacter sp. A1]RXV61349.1 ABC transporter permease [Fusibacter sp. A1]
MSEFVSVPSKELSFKTKVKNFVMHHIVMLIFLTICIAGIILANQSPFYLVSQLLERISRNTFLVLALIIPVIAGMGLNFSIIIGAMAGQIAVVIAKNFGFGGVGGMIFVMAVAVPIAILFGILIGKLLNKTRGQEMIASMIVGFFANGLYQLLFLVFVGLIIPMKNTDILLRTGVGLRNTVDLAGKNPVNDIGLTSDGLKYSIDSIWKMGIFNIMFFVGLVVFLFALGSMFRNNIAAALRLKEDHLITRILTPSKEKSKNVQIIGMAIAAFFAIWGFVVHYLKIGSPDILMIRSLKFPIVTAILIGLVALFNVIIQKTKLGQDFRTVGHDQHVAKISGIQVDKVRVVAITISTVLAAWGQIILLQNVGVLNTYGSHMTIGLFSVAALLVGGASVSKATNGQAFLGVLLFHTLFIVSPTAGKNLFGDPQIGEFFRAFVAYGVIGLSLGLYAWKRAMAKRSA